MPAPPAEPRSPAPPGLGKWWKNSDIVRALEITPAQVNQLEQTFLERRLKIIDLRAAVEREEVRLQPLVEADEIDEAKVSTQIDAVLAARARLEKENTMMMLALRRVLSVEQWKKLQSLQQEQEARQRWWFREQQEREQQGLRPRSPRPPEPPDIDPF
ncbi:MAG TPA: periplasmic heavy metal sensor [Candidatus Acidoferrales bacterium]